MTKGTNQKKHVVVNFHNLPVEVQDEVKKAFPNGFTESMIRIDKPSGDFFYAVVFETSDTSYLVKIDVKVDGQVEDEEDKEYYDDDIKGADDLINEPDEEEEEDRDRDMMEGEE